MPEILTSTEPATPGEEPIPGETVRLIASVRVRGVWSADAIDVPVAELRAMTVDQILAHCFRPIVAAALKQAGLS
jgi:hypothetical protein